MLELHGGLPDDEQMDYAYKLYNKPVLYGDPALNYSKAYEMVLELGENDIFLVVGCSYHTAIACDLREVAKHRGAKIIEIQEDAAKNVNEIIINDAVNKAIEQADTKYATIGNFNTLSGSVEDNTLAISDINDTTNGILTQSKNYTNEKEREELKLLF